MDFSFTLSEVVASVVRYVTLSARCLWTVWKAVDVNSPLSQPTQWWLNLARYSSFVMWSSFFVSDLGQGVLVSVSLATGNFYYFLWSILIIVFCVVLKRSVVTQGCLEVFLYKTVMHNDSLKEDVRSDCVDLILKGNDHVFWYRWYSFWVHHTAGELGSK